MTETDPSNSKDTFGDMSPDEFRRHGHRIVDWIADYLANPERFPVLAQVEPGFLKEALPDHAPEIGEPFERLLADFDRLIVPGITHWNQPGFLAYFATSGSAPGILGEMLSAALNVNAMMWRTSPSATELEEVTLTWLRKLIGLSGDFSGVIYDTASISTLCAIAAARENVKDVAVRERGLAGTPDHPNNIFLRMYASEQSHSSVERAGITLGIGQAGVRKIETDSEFRMDPKALVHAIYEDRAAGWTPFCVVATTGTTSTTSVDPVPAIAEICESEGLWLHVDAAYGGPAAILPEKRWILNGCDRADSLVINPHKWMFVPVDLSILYCRRMDVLRNAFSILPEYLRSKTSGEVQNFMDYGPQLGRRLRAIKLWFVMRYFGAEGLASRIREHIRLASEFASWVDQSPDFELTAPAPLSTVCFRANPASSRDGLNGEELENHLDRLNEQLMEQVNRTGRIFVSHTKLNGRFTIRLAIGNIRTAERHLREAWDLFNEALEQIRS